MISQLLGYAQYVGAAGFLIVILTILGFSALRLVNLEPEISSNELLLISPIVGLSVIAIPVTILASFEIAITTAVVWGAVVILLLPMLLKVVYKHEMKSLVSDLQGMAKKSYVLIPGVVAGFIPYLALFGRNDFPIGFGTSATWTNNDLGAYIQMATNVSKSGIADAGLVTGWNAGLQASFDHPGAHALFATIARLLHREPFQIGILLMVTIISALFLASVAVVGRLTNRPLSTLSSVGVLVVIVNPPIVAAITNFFYPHITSIAITVGFLALLLVLRQSGMKFSAFLLLASLTLATWLISIEIAVLMVPLISLFVLSQKSPIHRLTTVWYLAVSHFCVFAVGAITKFSLLKSQFDVFTRMSATGVAGWRTNFASPSMLLGLVPNQFGGPYSHGTRMWDLVLVAVALTFVSYLSIRQIIRWNLLVSILVLTSMVFIAINKWEIDAYQTWKLITTLTPFLFLLVLTVLYSLDISFSLGSWILLPLMTVGATFGWSSSIWKDSAASFLNKDLSQITHTAEIRRQDGLNILVAPYFETMSASVMSGVPTRMSSPSYYFFEGQELLYRCTLTTEEQLLKLKTHGPIVARRGKYLLVGTPSCN